MIGQTDLHHLRWNLAIAEDKQRAPIGRPASWRFVRLHIRDQARIASVDRIGVDLSIRTKRGDQFAVWSQNEC
jgi:hypothetical protein